MLLAQELSALRHQSESVDQSFGLRRSPARRGRVQKKLLVGLMLAFGGVATAAWYFVPGLRTTTQETPLVGDVVVGKFVHEIVERGDVRSSNNVEVRCEVQMRSVLQGTAILEIVPEGTFVEEGDFIARLDDSTLQNDLQLQTIDCNASAASVIQAKTSVETAKLSLEEYKSGTFKQEEETLQSQIFIAEENFRRAEEYLKYSERLAAKGYVTPIQLEADRFAVEKSQKELDVARTKLDVLRTYTKEKSIKQFEAALRTAEAQLSAALETDSVETAMLNKIKAQIAKCLIKAPKAGQVVYANDARSSSEDSVLIEEGKQVRERQIIVRLPNPQQMQVLAKINESRIDLVEPGMKARIAVDALPGVELEGRVRHVSEYPIQQYSTYTSHIKEYATEIEIVNPPEGLRPGMTAQAAVIVEERDQAAQVPVQAVFEREGRYYCLTHGDEGVQARQVDVGPTNEKFVVVEAGLQAGEQVVIAPRQYADRIALPTPIEFPRRADRPIVKAEAEAEPTQVAMKKTEASRAAPRRKPTTEQTTSETGGGGGAGL